MHIEYASYQLKRANMAGHWVGVSNSLALFRKRFAGIPTFRAIRGDHHHVTFQEIFLHGDPVTIKIKIQYFIA